ncbi:hypothetical protein BT96DRAFT_946329 [Gymnopus androsaceus JB14]|uniref:Uncharacterized protein n=1 Tax=Gymnopus androsaceus JB14 TaxID=1447944 RepID=A0A6A4GYQ6_9AGAR|nr:hypothetical protein BT96DRAFT_946329 [Gymnopus androsaceus JB14]
MPDKGKSKWKQNSSPTDKIKSAINTLRGRQNKKAKCAIDDDHGSTDDKDRSSQHSNTSNVSNPITDPDADPASIDLTVESDQEDDAKEQEKKHLCDTVAKRRSNAYAFFGQVQLGVTLHQQVPFSSTLGNAGERKQSTG